MRIKFLQNALLVLFAVILIRLFFWQVIMADELQAKAEDQHFEDVEMGAKRGDIYFSDGSTMATNKPTFLLYAEPKVLNDTAKKKITSQLAQILSEDDNFEEEREELFNQISRDLFWVPLRRNLSLEVKIKIEEQKLPGVGFRESSSRFYPEGSSSANLLGFVASNENTGYFGLEGFYNGELKGITGKIAREKDALGLPILIGKILGNNPRDGKSLTLNIDRSVQYIVEQSLKKGLEKYGARSASSIVIDPRTGGILALASYPSYDPGKYSQFPKEYYKNPIVADSYEPGSTFKVLVMGAAINEGLVEPETICDNCDGPVKIAGFDIRTWNNKYLENLTMKDTIIHSDNTGMVFAGKKLGIDKFYSYIENFGFGTITGVDLQDESSPSLREKKSWREIDLATVSFGQGIAVTPIQMVMAVGALANGGNLMEPHIVKEIKDEAGSFQIRPRVVRSVISEGSAKIITEMMVEAVDEGEAKFAKPKGFRIAGKTGTAQIPVAGHYDPNKTIASFVGFAPADNPKFVMLVRYDQPTSSIFGSETAAPTFFEIAKQLFTYYKIAPTE